MPGTGTGPDQARAPTSHSIAARVSGQVKKRCEARKSSDGTSKSARLDPTVERRQGHEVVDVDESEDPSDGRRYKPPARIFEPLWIA